MRPVPPAASRAQHPRDARAPRAVIAAAAAAALLEPMESRRMFSVTSYLDGGDLIVEGDNQANTITLSTLNGDTIVNGKTFDHAKLTGKIYVFTGGQAGPLDRETVNVLGNVRAIEILGEGDAPLDVNVGNNGSTGAIRDHVTVHGLNRGGSLTVNDSADTADTHVDLDTGAVDRVGRIEGFGVIDDGFEPLIRFDADFVDALTIKTGSGKDTFEVFDVHSSARSRDLDTDWSRATTTIETGSGDDVVHVRKVEATAKLVLQGTSGHDNVVVGDHGLTSKVKGDVVVKNVGSFTDLTVDDSADATARSVVMGKLAADSFFVGGLSAGSVYYNPNDTNSLTVNGGSGGNKFTVTDTFKSAGAAGASKTTLNTGSGADAVTVRRTTGALTVNGQAGGDGVSVGNFGSLGSINGAVLITNALGLTKLTLDDSASTVGANYVLGASTFTGKGAVSGSGMPATVEYVLNDVSQLTVNAGSGADAFFVNSTAVRTETTLNGGKGNDQFFVSNLYQNMDAIQRKVTANGQDGTDTVTVMDENAVGFHTYTTFADRVERGPNAAPVFYSGTEVLDVQRGSFVGTPPLVKDLAFTGNVAVGAKAKVTGRLEDADASDSLTLTVDWGDGSKPQTSQPGRDPFELTHKYKKAGAYAVRVIWTDSTGQSNHKDLTVVVTKAGKPKAKKALV